MVILIICAAVLPVRAAELQQLRPSDSSSAANFGYALATDGQSIVIGNGNGSVFGAAYLFDAVTRQQTHKLLPNDGFLGDHFGDAVDVSGNVAIVGQFSGNVGSVDTGSAYLFDVSSGEQLHKLTALNAAPLDGFGVSVGISGNVAIVGAYLDDDGGANAGAAYLYDVTTGQELHKLVASDAAASQEFGRTVVISGNLAIVGSFDQDYRLTPGSAYVFDVTTGQLLLKLRASDASPNDFFGISVAISGNIAIIGSRDDDENARGSAYLFDVTTGSELFKVTAPNPAEFDEFGRSVDIDGHLAIVGALGRDDAGDHSGGAYVFDVTSGERIATLVASDASEGDQFGRTVAISGLRAYVGAPFTEIGGNQFDDSGAVYVFRVPEPNSLVLFTLLFLTLSLFQSTRTRRLYMIS